MGKSLKYVKDFDFNAKPCNYSTGGSTDSCYAKGGKARHAPARRRVPVAPSQPVLNRLAAAAAPAMAPQAPVAAAAAPQGAPMGLKKGGAAKVGKVMGEYKAGKLHSGSKKGPAVTSRKQAIAIALSEAGKSKNRA